MLETKVSREMVFLTLTLESLDNDLQSLFNIGIQLEQISSLCKEHDDWNSPVAKIAIEHQIESLGIATYGVSLEDKVADTIKRIIKAIKATFKRAYEAIVRWTEVVLDRLRGLKDRLQKTNKELKDKEEIDITIPYGTQLTSLAIGDTVDLDKVVKRLQAVVAPLPSIKASSEKIIYKFNNAKRMGDVNALTKLSDDLMDYILKHYKLEGKKHVYTSKDVYPGNRHIVMDLTHPVPNFAFLQTEGVEVKEMTFKAKEVADAIDLLDLENVLKMTENVQEFAGQVDKLMKTDFDIMSGNRDVTTELLKIAAPIAAMLQKPPRTIIGYFTTTILELESLLGILTRQSPDKK